MINLEDYRELKKKNVVSIAKTGASSYAVSFKRFNPNTGETLPSEVLEAKLKDFEGAKLELQKKIEEIDTFIADCKVVN